MKFDKRNQIFFQIPLFFYFHGNCGKVCPTDSDFVIGDKSDILPSFINLTEILSTPVAFLTLNVSMTLDTNVSLVDETLFLQQILWNSI
jgi:hypothetical protein